MSGFGGAGGIKARMSRFETNKPALSKPALSKPKTSDEQSNGDSSQKVEPAPTETSSIRKRFQPPKREKCPVCSIYVYEVEKLTVEGVVYHKTCFKCSKCKNTLRMGNYASLDGQVFCKPHFIELFKQKGNYEEGFGKQRHKNKWLSKQGSTDSQTDGRHNCKQSTPEPTHNSDKPARHITKRDDEEKENKPSVQDKTGPSKTGVSSRFKQFGGDKSVPPPKPKPKPADVHVSEDMGDMSKPMDVDESDSGVVTTDPIQVGNMKARFEMEMKRAASGGAPISEARRDLEAMRAGGGSGSGSMKSRYEDAARSSKEIGQGDAAAEEEEQPKPRANMQNLLSRFKAIESGEKKAGHVVMSDEEDEGDEGEPAEANTSIRDELRTMKKASKFRSFFETVSRTGEGGRYSEDEDEDSMDVDNQK